MPNWRGIILEVDALEKSGDEYALDNVRLKYLKLLSEHTKRDTIIYASRWTSGDAISGSTMIGVEDIQGFMETINGLKNENLDIIIHTGGGSAEATDSIVSYLRLKFKNIRIIIPQAAMSAGTMLACSADVIVMGKQSAIGPIDPQFVLQTSVGKQMFPAQAILDQFKMIQEDCVLNPQNLNSWYPMLSQFGPALLVRCRDSITFAREMVCDWLKLYMFKDEGDIYPLNISDYLSDHNNFLSHGKHINITKAREIGLKIFALENDQKFQDLVLSVFHATTWGINSSNVTKIFANQNGNCFIKRGKLI